jgi:hypothetical protein
VQFRQSGREISDPERLATHEPNRESSAEVAWAAHRQARTRREHGRLEAAAQIAFAAVGPCVHNLSRL